MLYPKARTLSQRTANLAAVLLIGALFAATGLNAASGCGAGGECVRLGDFQTDAAMDEMPSRLTDRDGPEKPLG